MTIKIINATLKDGTKKSYTYDKDYDKTVPVSMVCTCGKLLKTKYSLNKHLKTKIHLKKLNKLNNQNLD